MRPRLLELLKRMCVGSAPASAGTATEVADQRDNPRRIGEPVEVAIRYPDGYEGPERGWVRDRSEDGLGVSVPQPVPVNTRFAVRALNAPDTVPCALLVVRSCRPLPGRYMLHSQYEAAPDPEALLWIR
jgi:hypothetical protein